MKTYLIVGGHDEAFSYLRNMAIEFVIIQIPEMLGEEQKDLAKEITTVNKLDFDSVLEAASKLHRKHKLDYIFSFTENGLLPSAYTAAKLNIPGIDYKSCLLCRDKAELRKHLKNTVFEIPSTKYHIESDLQDFHASVNGPIVLKDALGSGSKDVFICLNYAEASTAAKTLKANGCQAILAEKHLSGTELSIETMTINGKHECLGITQKTLFSNTVIERQHIYPAQNISNELKLKLKDFSLNLLHTIKHKYGPCHIEVIVNNNDIFLIEINNRGGGDFIWQMVLMVSGVDVIRETLNYAFDNFTGQNIRQENIKYNVMSSISFFNPVDTTSLKKKLSGLCDIIRLNCDNKPRHNYEVLHSWDRFGFLVVGHNDVKTFNKNIIKINQLVEEAEKEFSNSCKV